MRQQCFRLFWADFMRKYTYDSKRYGVLQGNDYICSNICSRHCFALRSITLTLAITIELAALFVFLVYIFLARVASDNIIDVEESEDVKKALISELRSKAQMLSSFDDNLGNMSSDMVKAIKKIDEDMRYLSPSSSSEAQELESQMLTVIDSILSSGCFRAGGNGAYELLEAKLKEFDLLYKQRKIYIKKG